MTGHPKHRRAAAAALALQLLGAAIVFGGVYFWSSAALAATALVFLVTVGRDVGTGRRYRLLDLALLAVLVAVVFQIVPLPAALVRALAPTRETFANITALRPEPVRFFTLSLNPWETFHAWLTLFAIAATFWVARSVFARGGVRTFTIVITWGAIALGVMAFVQHASGSTDVYGFWQPRDAGARPLGPFINRNHFGTWAIMAVSLCAGYLRWRAEGRQLPTGWRARLAAALDGRGIVLWVAVILLSSAIALGASRSSLVALAVSVGYVALARSPHSRGGRASLGVLAIFAIIAMLAYGDGERLLLRIDETRTTGMASRMAIWRDTVTLIQDFPLAGAGAGAFATAMQVYQTTPRTYYHNEAHNQYLQLAAEGGLLLAAPALVAGAAFITLASRQLRRGDDHLRWMRVGAAGALLGVAVQSLWETGLTVPANGMFAAALAGLIVHSPAVRVPSPDRGGAAVEGH